MKTKLFSLVVLVAFAACTFAVNQANRSDKERLDALEKTVAAQQAELDKLRPLGEAMYVHPSYPVLVCTIPVIVDGAWLYAHNIWYDADLRYIGAQ